MALLADYHTHTPYSHGKNTIEENVAAAYEKGLSQIAITDHGFNHAVFPVKRDEIESQRKEIKEIKDKYPIDILLGVEANIISKDGRVDILPQDYYKLDIIIVGYHKLVKHYRKRDFWFFFGNLLSELFGHYSKRQIANNTRAYINAMRNYDIDIIAHLNKDIKVNVEEVAKVAAETNTYIELNGKCDHLTDAEIMICLNAGCKFVINSDAHDKNRVGECHRGLSAMLRNRIPESAVGNYNKIITLKSTKRKKAKK